MSVDVSPDGETLVFDLLGDLYLSPITGGEAVPITTGMAWDQGPRFSPDGVYVYFVSDREGYKNLWRLSLADQSLQQITHSKGDILGAPNWSQNRNRLLAGVYVRTGPNHDVFLHAIHPITGEMDPLAGPDKPLYEAGRRVRKRVSVFSGVESADSKVFYSETGYQDDGPSRKVSRLFMFDVVKQTRIAITPTDVTYSDFKPQLSNDGTKLAYYRQYKDRRTELRVLDRTTGIHTALIQLDDVDDAEYSLSDDTRPNYSFTPDDRSLIFWHNGKIRSVNVASGQMSTVPFRVSVEREIAARLQPTAQQLRETFEAAAIRWPSLSRDGRMLAFSAVGYVWVADRQTGDVRRLTDSDDFEYMPTMSPDGSSVAYTSFAQSGDEYGFGRLMVADLAGGEARELLAGPGMDHLLPAWSDDGSKIAVIRDGGRGKGGEAAFGWTPASAGTFHEVQSSSVVAFGGFRNLFIYARSVGFDTTGRKLLFSYPRSIEETILVATDIATGASETLAVGASDVGGITPAPDLKHLVLTRRDGSVWLVPFDADEAPVAVSSFAHDARRVSENVGYYVDWNDSRHVTFGFAKNVYRYQLDDGKLKTARIGLPIATPKSPQKIAFTNARLITMSGTHGSVIEEGTLVVDGARIAAIGPASSVTIPASAHVIDAAGKTIMPGLLDTHYHALGPSALALPSPSGFGFSEKTAINFGITSAWGPGHPFDDGIAAISDLQLAGRIKGPRWSNSAAGAAGYPYEFFTSYAAALGVVERSRDLGFYLLKEYTVPTRQQQQWLSAAAREGGLGIVSHLEDFDGTMTRIVDGYTGGDHPYIPVPFYKDVAELLRQSGFIWTPNVVIASGTIGVHTDQTGFYCEAFLRRQAQSPFELADPDSICGLEDHREPSVEYQIYRASRVTRYVAFVGSNGARIGASAHNVPGSNLSQELWSLWRGGMPIEDVLRAATMVNAEKLGLQEEIGSLETGKVADFIVLRENPLEDILNTLSLQYTVQGGVVYDSSTAQRVDVRDVAGSQHANTLH